MMMRTSTTGTPLRAKRGWGYNGYGGQRPNNGTNMMNQQDSMQNNDNGMYSPQVQYDDGQMYAFGSPQQQQMNSNGYPQQMRNNNNQNPQQMRNNGNPQQMRNNN